MSKNIVTLRSVSESFKVIESGTIRKMGYGLLLVFYSDFVPKTCHFWDTRLQIYSGLETRVMSH